MGQVSIIIAFLDAVRFIEEAIESVLAQTYTQWELFLIDDGSTDGSSEIALRYAAQYPGGVRYLEHPEHQNRGVAASRNLAILKARGEYIAFLDADDVWLPQKLERQVGLLGSHPEAAMVYGLDQWWHSWTGRPEDSRRDFIHELGVTPDRLFMPPALVIPLFLRQEAAIPCPAAVLVRRQALETIGGFEASFQGIYGVYEDQAFFSKIFLNAPVFVSRECLSRYRQHASSACYVAKKGRQEYAARLFFLKWLARYLTEQGVGDARIWKEVHREIRRCHHPRLSRLLRAGHPVSGQARRVMRPILRRVLPGPARIG